MFSLDWNVIGGSVAVISFGYAYLRNFKQDIHSRIDRMENRLESLEERMFLLATGRTLEEAMLQQAVKRKVKKAKKGEK